MRKSSQQISKKNAINIRGIEVGRAVDKSMRCCVPLVVLILTASHMLGCDREADLLPDATPSSIDNIHATTSKSVSRATQDVQRFISKAEQEQLNETLASNNHFKLRQNEECCSDPGAIAECWWQDAEADGAACLSNDDCNIECDKDVLVGGSVPPNEFGLCTCSDGNDCASGICTEDGHCGPSYCNGYRVCSCWGGCTDATLGEGVDGSGNLYAYDTPADMCSDLSGGYPGECCEGNYPSAPSGISIGFCSVSCSGMGGAGECETDGDCVDPIPEPYSTNCLQWICDTGRCRPDYYNQSGACSANIQIPEVDTDEEPYWGSEVRDEASEIYSCFVGRCDAAGKCNATTGPVDGEYCDNDEPNLCTEEQCLDGRCAHIPVTSGVDCDADGKACTLDECDAAGNCIVGPEKDCTDYMEIDGETLLNWCTYQDQCQPAIPGNNVLAECVNPEQDGNASLYEYVDTQSCVDLICTAGMGEWVATDCDYRYAETGFDDQCNLFACNPANPVNNNCEHTYSHLIDATCSDGQYCTVGDRCVDVIDPYDGDHGVCESTEERDCDDDDPCTDDGCDEDNDQCTHTYNTATCDDGDLCTENDTCNGAGTCLGTPVDCSGIAIGEQCKIGRCDPAFGTCYLENLEAGENCNADNNPCTPFDTCDGAGTCVADDPRNCESVGDECNEGVCDPADGQCVKSPYREGETCTGDNSLCTDDLCDSGECVVGAGGVVSCATYNNECNYSFCNASTGACEYDNAGIIGDECDSDTNGCTIEHCDGVSPTEMLSCTPTGTVNCDDSNVCTTEVCVSDTNYTSHCEITDVASGEPCNNDSNGCTRGDACDGSGNCAPGEVVTPTICTSELAAELFADFGFTFDTDCNSAQCISDGDDAYHCEAVERASFPGICNDDNNACTEDTCIDFNVDQGAVCTTGDLLNCSSLNTVCANGQCSDSGDGYNAACISVDFTDDTECDGDDDGCTVHTCQSGICTYSHDHSCTPSDSCMIAECVPLDEDTPDCEETPIPGCCETVADCLSEGLPCDVGGECSELVCNVDTCECSIAPEGTPCTMDPETIPAYPENCYEPLCDTAGSCQQELIELANVENNLCSDLFSGGSGLDTSNIAYLGAIPASATPDDDPLSATGSTVCGSNNYQATGENCVEATTGEGLGATGNDMVYSFRYQTNLASDTERYAYVIKVEGEFDTAVYVQDDVSGADDCPEGDNPTADVGGSGSPVARLGTWQSNANANSVFYGSAPDGDDRLLVVGIQVEHSFGETVNISNVTYGGQNGTRLSTQDAGDMQLVELWLFDELDISNQSGGLISVTHTGDIVGRTIHAAMYENVNQSDPVADIAEAATASSIPNPIDSVNVNAVEGSMVVSFSGCGHGTGATWTFAMVEGSHDMGTSTAGTAADMEVTSAGVVNCLVEWDSQNRAAQWAIVLNPASPGPYGSTLNWSCSYPYADTPMPPVYEEMCADGNNVYDQNCCNPCGPVENCGYKWCTRGYRISDNADCEQCGGSGPECEAFWQYPDEPIECISQKPTQTGYDSYTNMALTVISPDFETNGEWRNAVIIVDGANGDTGNFHISVEKRLWTQNPCDRASDDATVTDVTDAGASGFNYSGSIDNLVNGDHQRDDPGCGGYLCDGGWQGDSSCHSGSSTPNQFWPAEAYLTIYREIWEGSADYCVTTTSPGANALDAVLILESAAGAQDICYEDFVYEDCAHANYQTSDARLSFSAEVDTQYKIGVSRFEGLNRPCLNAEGDDCDYNIEVREGACPEDCIDIGDWYSGQMGGAAVNLNGVDFPTTATHATLGEFYSYLLEGDTSTAGHGNDFDLGEGWDANDEVWQLNYTGATPATVYLSGCQFGGYGAFNGRMALYDCRGNLVLEANDDACGVGGMPAFSYEMSTADQPYYLVFDGNSAESGNEDHGPYGIAIYYDATCSDNLQNGLETGVDCGGPCAPCAPTCSDGIQNQDETGVDCGGTICEACACGVDGCRLNANCTGGTPWCDTSVLDGDGCGVCRSYFVQCNNGDPNTQIDYNHHEDITMPMAGGCINMNMDNTTDWNNISNTNNRGLKIQNRSSISGSCIFPYTFSWTTTYCAAVNGVETLNDSSLSLSDIQNNCTSVGEMRGRSELDAWYADPRIPLRRYALSVDIQFEGNDDCVMDMTVVYDVEWGTTDPASITCPTDAVFGPEPITCDPNPPALP